ncbi:MAG: hemolysin secretion protein D [Gammaproteobacteria bacterium]|nr:MAG: hemolysin secretion protein D [Gammaproteobacteria bacterium]
MKQTIPQEQLDYIRIYDRAAREQHYSGSRIIVLSLVLILVMLVVWAKYATIDEVTRGMGVVIPSGKIQTVQNLEGGIVEELLVRDGDQVVKGQALIKIKNQQFESIFKESKSTINGLALEIARLRAELNHTPLVIDPELKTIVPAIARIQSQLYESNTRFLLNQQRILEEKIKQKQAQIDKYRLQIKHLAKKARLLKQQIDITQPLVERKIESQTDFLDLQRKQADIIEQKELASSSIPELKSQIAEMQKKKEELAITFRTRAQKELSEALTRKASLVEKQATFKDQVSRTLVTAPSAGIVKQIHVNTLGQVVKPGMDLVEIVPLEDNLLVEARIRPSDIAFLHPGQKATVKVTAYDFSIYGGLPGRVERISADTLEDERNQTYFLVEIVTPKTNLGTKDKPLEIIPGMTVSVDIITGKKTILSYILKPLLKAKQNALTER